MFTVIGLYISTVSAMPSIHRKPEPVLAALVPEQITFCCIWIADDHGWGSPLLEPTEYAPQIIDKGGGMPIPGQTL